MCDMSTGPGVQNGAVPSETATDFGGNAAASRRRSPSGSTSKLPPASRSSSMSGPRRAMSSSGHSRRGRLDDFVLRLGPVLGIFAEPEDEGSDEQGGAVVGGSFGVAGGQRAELLEAGEAAFDDVAPGVDRGVEGRRAAAG